MGMNEIVTQLTAICGAVDLVPDAVPPTCYDLDATPAKFSRGDCPAVVFLPTLQADSFLAFVDGDGLGEKGRQDIEINCIYFDEAEFTGQVWESRPRTSQYINDLLAALHANPQLNGTITLCTASSTGANDNIKYNGVPYRGAVIRVKGFLFTV